MAYQSLIPLEMNVDVGMGWPSSRISRRYQGTKRHQRGACILCDTYLYCILYCICMFWRRPPETVAAAASAMAPRVLAVHLALGYAQCLTLSSIM
jgi:hypothetical protein